MKSLSHIEISRIQFGINITFHIIFPSITIALSWFLLFFKIMHNKTKQAKWMEIYSTWVKIFALTFAIGAVSGITMSSQFGSNWPGFMEKFGNIAGPFLAYEVLTAFFLEATFLGIMLFGINKVSNKVHTISTILVAIGTTLSAFWIMALGSWMQTPDGFKMIDGVAYPENWLKIVFNPSMVPRFIHMILASGLTAAFLIAGISAYCIIKKGQSESTITAFKSSIICAAILSIAQLFSGDALGLNSLKHQPAKVASIEAMWETGNGMPLRIFVIPDNKLKKNRFEIGIPKIGGLILTHTMNGTIRGINEFPEHPPVMPLFFSFRIMFGIGGLMILISWFSIFKVIYKKQMPTLLLKSFIVMTFSGLLATILGWYVTEIGRQPYIVYGILKTKDAAALIPKNTVTTSMFLYLAVYLLILIAYIKTIFYIAQNQQNKNITQ